MQVTRCQVAVARSRWVFTRGPTCSHFLKEMRRLRGGCQMAISPSKLFVPFSLLLFYLDGLSYFPIHVLYRPHQFHLSEPPVNISSIAIPHFVILSTVKTAPSKSSFHLYANPTCLQHTAPYVRVPWFNQDYSTLPHLSPAHAELPSSGIPSPFPLTSPTVHPLFST